MAERRGKLKAFTEGIDAAWEDFIYDPASGLSTLLEVANIDAQWLPLLSAMAGLGRDLNFEANTAELRRIIGSAMPFWGKKTTEAGMINGAIRLVTANRFRIANFFDYRMQVGIASITEELADLDPMLIGFPSGTVSGAKLTFCTATAAPPCTQQFFIDDLPDPPRNGRFENPSQFAWLVIPSGPNAGTYEIDKLIPGTGNGTIVGVFPAPHTGEVSYKLTGYMAEVLTEVRLVDRGVGRIGYDAMTTAFTVGARVYGTVSGANGLISADDELGASGFLTLRGVKGRFEDNEPIADTSGGAARVQGRFLDGLNRDLVRFFINISRPLSERVDIVYIGFVDEFFLTTTEQWDIEPTLTSAAVTTPGVIELDAGASIVANDPEAAMWDQALIVWKVEVSASGVIDLLFCWQDALNFYHVRADYSAQTIALWKTVGGAPGIIGSAVAVQFLLTGFDEVIRVEFLKLPTAANRQIRVNVGNKNYIDTLEAPAAWQAGSVGAYAHTGSSNLKLVEVLTLPAEIERAGLNP